LSQLGFLASLKNRGGIGCADFMPPPLLGARAGTTALGLAWAG